MNNMKVALIVFCIIALFLVAATLTVSIPEQSTELRNLGKAPELAGIQGWINSEPLKIEELRGKVVLVDFWTYSCINCIRTIPHLNIWHDKYSNKGLVIVGVHTPEFEFEKNYENVKNAVNNYGIKYAVAQDNDYETWRAYSNRYWPRKYIIDKEGNIRYDHIGEGAYEETELVIQKLLREIDPFLRSDTANVSQDTDFSRIGSPEIYLGYTFARAPLGNAEGFFPGNIVNYTLPEITTPNVVYLSGKWKNEADRIISIEDSELFLFYKAKNVNIVAGGNSNVLVLSDGRPVNGADVTNSTVFVNGHRLYNVVSGINYNSHILSLHPEPGLELYTFTFG
jgi:thiol-disulfide isomerase/thioredoxin